MANKNDFTQDEWKRVIASPMLAGMAVTMAEPSGLFGMLKEAAASGRAVLEARTAPGANELIQAIGEGMNSSEGRGLARDGVKAELTGKTAAEIKAHVLTALGEIGQLLDAKAPQDAPAVKAWLQQVARKVAESSTEGGFLGFGGVRVSENEKATLAEIAKVLNLP